MKFAAFLFTGYVIHQSLIQPIYAYYDFECRGMDATSLAVTCVSNNNSVLQLPPYIPYNVQLLLIDAKNGGTLVIQQADVFTRFHSLKTLEISVSKSLVLSEGVMKNFSKSVLSETIFNLTRLECLSIEYGEYNIQNYEWKLPLTMVKVRLLNSVFEFNIKHCEKLIGLRLDRNEMSALPDLHINAKHNFRRLDVKFNPMDKLTVNDLASFCEVSVVILKNATINDNCECRKIKKWLDEWNIWANHTGRKFRHDSNLMCSDKSSGSTCSESFVEAYRLRDTCAKIKIPDPYAPKKDPEKKAPEKKAPASAPALRILKGNISHWIIVIAVIKMSTLGGENIYLGNE